MDDQRNNDLRNRINEVFDRFEVPAGAADAGWTELRKRFPAQQRRNAAAWWWSSAAAVLLLVGLGLWLYQPAAPVKNQLAQHQPKQPVQQSPAVKDSAIHTELPTASAQQLAAQNPQHQPDYYRKLKPTDQAVDQIKTTYPAYTAATKQPYKSIDTSTSGNPIAIAMQPVTPLAGKILSVDSVEAVNTLATATPATETKTDANSIKNAEAKTGMDALFAREATMAKNAEPKTKPKTAADQRLALSVYAGTFINYAKGSNNEVNVGAGISSDIKLAKRFKLVTGIAIAQNKLSYDNQPTDARVYAAAVAATGGHDISVFNSASPAFFAPAVNARNTTQILGYNASFTGLDIPVNIKYDFGSGNSDTYVLAGISSGTFINETYQYNYSSSAFNSISQTAETQAKFSTFDFARTLNFAFGVGTPVGKTNRLIIEPFLKYPISGMGSQQIRFGASGINLKFKFLSHK